MVDGDDESTGVPGADGVEVKTSPGHAAGPRHPIFVGWRASRIACVVLVVGLFVVAALTLTSLAVNHHDEKQLLESRAKNLGLVLAEEMPLIQTPLGYAGISRTPITGTRNGSRNS